MQISVLFTDFCFFLTVISLRHFCHPALQTFQWLIHIKCSIGIAVDPAFSTYCIAYFSLHFGCMSYFISVSLTMTGIVPSSNVWGQLQERIVFDTIVLLLLFNWLVILSQTHKMLQNQTETWFEAPNKAFQGFWPALVNPFIQYIISPAWQCQPVFPNSLGYEIDRLPWIYCNN